MDESLSPVVQVDFTLSVGEGRLDASLSVPSGEINLTQLLPVLQTLSSNIVASTAQIASNEGYTVSCQAGCGACCRQIVPISIFEAEALAEWIHTLPQAQQDVLEQRFHAALDALRDSGILARIAPEHWVEGSAETKNLAIDYLLQRVPCPFLVEESCSIHPIRPLICREYLVTSPRAFCEDPSQNPVVGIPMPVKLSRTLFQIGAQVENNARGWIPLVFLFAWMKSGAQPGQAISGPGPGLLYEIVKRLTTK